MMLRVHAHIDPETLTDEEWQNALAHLAVIRRNQAREHYQRLNGK